MHHLILVLQELQHLSLNIDIKPVERSPKNLAEIFAMKSSCATGVFLQETNFESIDLPLVETCLHHMGQDYRLVQQHLFRSISIEVT